MRVRVELDIEVGEDAYADACEYFRYQYGEVPSNLLAEPDEPDYAEVVLNAIEAVVADLIGNYDETPVLEWDVVGATVKGLVP